MEFSQDCRSGIRIAIASVAFRPRTTCIAGAIISAPNAVGTALGIMSAGIDKFQRIPVHVTVAVVRLRIGRVGNDRIRLDEAVKIRRIRVSAGTKKRILRCRFQIKLSLPRGHRRIPLRGTGDGAEMLPQFSRNFYGVSTKSTNAATCFVPSGVSISPKT